MHFTNTFKINDNSIITRLKKQEDISTDLQLTFEGCEEFYNDDSYLEEVFNFFSFSPHNTDVLYTNLFFNEKKRTLNVSITKFLNASTCELIRRLAKYVGLLAKTKYLVLRNTIIHLLSLFFGLCCSSPGLIFNAITGTSSYPFPVK